MQNRKKLAGLILGGVALTGLGVGATATAFADPTPTPSAGATPATGQSGHSGDQPGGKRGHGKGGDHEGQLAQQLAEKLGVDQTKVSDALKAIHQANKSSRAATPGTAPDPAARRAELAKQLAEKLGIDEAKVTTALNEIDQARSAEQQTAFKARLDKAVADGKISQAEADAVQKAADAGVIPKGGRGR